MEIGDNEISETPRKSRHGEDGTKHPQGEPELSPHSLKFRQFRSFRCSHLGIQPDT
jgi:hypothetical protein